MDLPPAVDVSVERFETNPLVTPEAGDRLGTNVNGPSVIPAPEWIEDPLGTNVNGPSVIRAPEWVADPLGRYYMYFASHRGDHVRLAVADDPRGPWSVHEPGVLAIGETRFDGHVASPDAHVDEDEERVRLYFHGCCGPFDHAAGPFEQVTDVAVARDGLDFSVRGRTLGNSYFRVWAHDGAHYAVANDGHLYRGADPLAPFERRQELFPRNRHAAVRRLDEETLQVFLTRRGDRPERVMAAAIDLSRPVEEWRPEPHPPETVLWPEREYEGGSLPVVAGERGAVDRPVRALRDPAVLETDEGAFLFYAVAGERGIAGAELR